MAWGYLQLPLSEQARPKTAFITETQTGEFTRAMFGLANAPRYFAKLMDRVLSHVRKKGIVFNFFDDMCVFADTWENLMKNLEEVLVLLIEAGLTLRLNKCKFGMLYIEYLGYILGNGEISPGDRKIRAIEDFPRPRNKHDIRRFHGLTSFFWRFVPKFSLIARPLTILTKSNVIFAWGSEQEKAFNDLKKKLVCHPVLKLYNPAAFRTKLHTDASADGLAGMLMQKDKSDGPLQLVYAISCCTNEAESKYHSSRLELMAVAWALERLRPFLIGIKLYVITDCQSLVHMNAWKTKNAQIARWMSQISEYDLEVIHRRGESMKHVDALSRAPVNNELNDKQFVMSINSNEDEVLMFQRSDLHILKIINALNKNEKELDNDEKNLSKNFILKDGLLFKRVLRENVERDVYVVPNAMRKSIVILYHDCMSHFGVDKTVRLIEKYYYFPRLRAYVRVHIKNCLACILAKKKTGSGEGELHPIPAGKRPFDVIHTDQ